MKHARVVEISIEGVKAYDRKVALSGPLLALVGPVGSGKSSILDAVRFAALGYVPFLGGREADTARIMRGPRMHVRLELDDGRHFSRTLTRDGASLRLDSRASWLPASATNTAHSVAIRGLFGDSDAEAAECIDLRELVDASPSQRATRIEALLSATAMRPDEAASILAGLTVSRLAKIDEARLPSDTTARDALVTGLLPTLDRSTVVALNPMLTEAKAKLRAGGVPVLLVHAGDAKREANEAVRKKRAARAELEDKSRAIEVPKGTLAEFAARRQAATDRIATLRANVGAAETVAASRADATLAVTKAKAPVRDHDDVRKSVAEARADAARWKSEAEAIADPKPVPSPKLVETDPKTFAKADALEASARDLDAEAAKVEGVAKPSAPTDAAPRDETEPGTAVTRADEALARAKASPWEEVRTIADEVEALAIDAESDADAPKNLAVALRELADANGGDVKAAQKILDAAHRRLSETQAFNRATAKGNAAAREAHAKAVAKWGKEREKAVGIREAASAKRVEASKIRTEELARVSEANRETVAAHKVKADAIVKTVETNKARRRTLLAQAESAIENADADDRAIVDEAAALAEAEARLSGIAETTGVDVAGSKDEIAALVHEVEVIDATKTIVDGADARKRELDTLAGEILTGEASAVVATALEWAAQRLRERDLASRGGPIMARMRTFIKAAGIDAEPFLRATKGATDFGWRRGERELSIEALSGGEAVLFGASLAAAIVALRAPIIRCVLVEAAEVGAAEPAAALLRGLAAVADGADAIVTATCAPISPLAPWQTERFVGAVLPVK